MRGIRREFPARDSREFLACSSEFMALAAMKASRSACKSEIALHRGINIVDRRVLLAILRPSIAPVLLEAAFAVLSASASTASARTSLQSREVKLEKD